MKKSLMIAVKAVLFYSASYIGDKIWTLLIFKQAKNLKPI